MSHRMTKQTKWCAPAKTDQPGHLSSLIRVFAVRLKKHWVLNYLLRARWRPIRLGGCPGWSKSLLDAHIILLVFSCGGSNVTGCHHNHLAFNTWSKSNLQANKNCLYKIQSFSHIVTKLISLHFSYKPVSQTGMKTEYYDRISDWYSFSVSTNEFFFSEILSRAPWEPIIVEPRHEKTCSGICEQQRRRSASLDLRLCCSLLR